MHFMIYTQHMCCHDVYEIYVKHVRACVLSVCRYVGQNLRQHCHGYEYDHNATQTIPHGCARKKIKEYWDQYWDLQTRKRAVPCNKSACPGRRNRKTKKKQGRAGWQTRLALALATSRAEVDVSVFNNVKSRGNLSIITFS